MPEDGIKEYIEYGKRLIALIDAAKRGQAETVVGTPIDYFGFSLLDTYKQCHLYMIEEATKKLLMMTNPPKVNKMLRLPFQKMFIGCHFTREDVEKFFGQVIEYKEIWGMILEEGKMTLAPNSNIIEEVTGNINKDSIEIEMGNNLRIVACCEDDKGIIEFNTMHINCDFDEELDMNAEIQEYSKIKKTKKFCKMFAMNILNLIHDPEIEFVQRSRESMKDENAKRVLRGKVPLPGMTAIRLTGKRKIYVDSLLAGNSFHYSHEFFVRGFYRQLKSERYVNALKENPTGRGFGIIWVNPTRKGQGILIQKDYDVDVSKEED